MTLNLVKTNWLVKLLYRCCGEQLLWLLMLCVNGNIGSGDRACRLSGNDVDTDFMYTPTTG